MLAVFPWNRLWFNSAWRSEKDWYLTSMVGKSNNKSRFFSILAFQHFHFIYKSTNEKYNFIQFYCKFKFYHNIFKVLQKFYLPSFTGTYLNLVKCNISVYFTILFLIKFLMWLKMSRSRPLSTSVCKVTIFPMQIHLSITSQLAFNSILHGFPCPFCFSTTVTFCKSTYARLITLERLHKSWLVSQMNFFHFVNVNFWL